MRKHFGLALAALATAFVGDAAAQGLDQAPWAGALPSPVPDQPNPAAGFEIYKRSLVNRALREGVSQATAKLIPSLRLNERALQLDYAQRPISNLNFAAPPSLAPYLRAHVTPSLISRGRARYYNLWPNLVRIHQRFGVDPAVIMAIYGKETSYGRFTGGFDLLEVLASLSYEGRRRELFESEFIAALKLIDDGLPREQLKGSYAGATGYPQFMPSVVRSRRADGDGDSIANIWSNEPDALASIANYLRYAGWKAGVPWGTAVHVPISLDRNSIRRTVESERCPAVYRRHSRELTIAQWRALGVVPTHKRIGDSELAVLMEPDGAGQQAYLLTANYRAILTYNCSNFYGMSVALLADAIARREQPASN